MAPFDPLPPEFYRRPAEAVAPALIGRYLVRRIGGRRRVLKIVETEAYLGASDRASHAWGDRRTARTQALFRDGGVAYVYLIYGLHHMLNAVTGGADDGSAVLLRAGEPIAGGRRMARARGLVGAPAPGAVAGGPGKLCAALSIGLDLNGATLHRGPLTVCEGEPASPAAIEIGARVGVDYAGAAARWPLRFALRDNAHVSRPAVVT